MSVKATPTAHEQYFQRHGITCYTVYQAVKQIQGRHANPLYPGLAFTRDILAQLPSMKRPAILHTLGRLVKDGLLEKPFHGAYRVVPEEEAV